MESVSPSSQMIRTKPSYPRAALNGQKVENTTNKVMCPGRVFSFRERSTTIFVLDFSSLSTAVRIFHAFLSGSPVPHGAHLFSEDKLGSMMPELAAKKGGPCCSPKSPQRQ